MVDAASGGPLMKKTPHEASDLIINMAANAQPFRTREDNAPRHVKENLGNQITQLATAVSNLEAQNCGKLPSQTVVNPRENASAMVLRSGKKIEIGSTSHEQNNEGKYMDKEVKDTFEEHAKVKPKSPLSGISNVVIHPFPSRLERSKKADYDNEVLDTFRKVEINIPLIDAIKQIPRYAKFLKDFWTKKRRLRGDAKVSVGENVSAVIKRVVIQLADRSNAYPKGVVEDVLVQVKELIFPADFYILRMEEDSTSNSPPILLGRPFLKTARTKIDVDNGTLYFEFDGEIEVFEEEGETENFQMYAQLDVEEELAETYEISEQEIDQTRIVIAQEDQEKITFTCPFGTFAYKRMPFGLYNAPCTFQRCMLSIFSEYIENCIEVFMDDFTVYGNSFEVCLDHLSKILKRCIKTSLVLNYEKCHFMVNEGIVLGYVVSSRSIEVDKAKIGLITHLPFPTKVKEVRAFLGHAGFYRRFIKDFSKIALTMSKLLQKDVPFEFGEKFKNAFDKLKNMLTTATIIKHPDWTLPLEIMCDVGNYVVGAVLGQQIDKKSHVIYYASKTLDPAQCNYTTTEKELLAIVFALDKFRSYLLGSKVLVYSDHAALKYLLAKNE
ncbi:uncharacterized protein [Henckelia pumila]|uniref:uncharacterized protein n=1 Tax=Henckelia pumila TaxID=405737 RepID=UPI003C6DE900